MEREQAVKLMQDLLRRMVQVEGSDLFITKGFPPAIKVDGEVNPVMDKALTSEQSALIVRSIMNDKQTRQFDSTKECNFAINPKGIGRFRVSAFVQQGYTGAVLRTIITKIPTIEDLELPNQLADVVMNKLGLAIIVGGTGSGKSTTLAAMIRHRNENTHGHIVTIEDPVEYVHPHINCVVTQREVGVDTETWLVALKNALRQAPDVILIGEIRDRETMEYAIQFSETGHLCLATLHANSANQALDRIINFFPEERRGQLLMDLSLNIKALISQRLIRREGTKGRVAAMEILLASPLINDLILRGEIYELKEIMAKSNRLGMQTFDQALFALYESGTIAYDDAMRNADSRNELRLRIKLESERGSSAEDAAAEKLSVVGEEK
ncbi:MAG: PilT/PilU family type 4a pilus ATPase [Proteobacteria bacterium]|nr:PilT/PilU family type 4a pilus ATPase [Pseudomonadota bacterium]